VIISYGCIENIKTVTIALFISEPSIDRNNIIIRILNLYYLLVENKINPSLLLFRKQNRKNLIIDDDWVGQTDANEPSDAESNN
jgi:hypothetical protein